MKRILTALVIGLSVSSVVWAQDEQVQTIRQQLQVAQAGAHRSADNIGRNQYRHPAETLAFFGLRNDMTVLEIWPGSGWYTEVLAPVLRTHGQLIVASYDTSIPDQPEYRYRLDKVLRDKLQAQVKLFGDVGVTAYSDPITQSLGDDNSVDMVLTFRNVHGWIGGEIADDVFADFYAVLKPGGHLGVVQHRAPVGADPEQSVPAGYVPEATVIAIAEAAGFSLVGRSEVNANPADDHDHPEGVWTLPPTLELGDQDREQYLAIGESDRMTLLFKK